MKTELGQCSTESSLQPKSCIKSRSFRSHGGSLILFQEIVVLILTFFAYDAISQGEVGYKEFLGAASVGMFLFPFTGWLGDAILGRYYIIKYIVIVLWVSSVTYSTIAVTLSILEELDSLTWKIVSSIWVVIRVNLCGSYMVSSFHLGVDQLMDAPSWQVSSFISWYCWSFFVAAVIKMFFTECLLSLTVNAGFASMAITVALCLDLLCNKVITKEPPASNSLKVIFQVVRYAVKNKYPRLRSAFSYWDEKKSRINLAKAVYGGPFTSEEVEAVKTFFKIVPILFLGSCLGGCIVVAALTTDSMFYHYSDHQYHRSEHDTSSYMYEHCLVRSIVSNGASYCIILGIPLFECLLHPFIWRFVILITSSKKFVFGMFLLFLNQCSNLVLELVGHASASSGNATCLFDANQTTLADHQTVSLSFYWLFFPKLFSGLSYYLLFTSTAEFMCAQSPFFMKSLIVGIIFSFFIVAIAVCVSVRAPFHHLHGVGGLSCGVWYFIFLSLLMGLGVFSSCALLKWYSSRRRRENMQDEHSVTNYSSISNIETNRARDRGNYYM